MNTAHTICCRTQRHKQPVYQEIESVPSVAPAKKGAKFGNSGKQIFNIISAEKKSQYWNHFTDKSRSVYRPKQITDIRLSLIKEIIFGDDFLWHEFVAHNYVLDKTPNELSEASPLNYKNARANFWAMIRKVISRQSTD